MPSYAFAPARAARPSGVFGAARLFPPRLRKKGKAGGGMEGRRAPWPALFLSVSSRHPAPPPPPPRVTRPGGGGRASACLPSPRPPRGGAGGRHVRSPSRQPMGARSSRTISGKCGAVREAQARGLAPPSPPRGGRVTHVRASPRAVVRSLPRRLPLGGGARAACGAGTRAVVIGAGGGGGRGRSGGRLSQGVL